MPYVQVFRLCYDLDSKTDIKCLGQEEKAKEKISGY
jgi:hypothetical protein